ncbi:MULTISPECIES: FAD-dependent monooxygenase [Streptomyces]|uniref:FAD-dependent monooxygenase n=1 Tax=Streptomyces doudnae TaxID=3075536 RepID=A0ABD5F188_9ACTN|nr:MULTISPECIES: FAD-dependent monooxygenase [unclassified Streptomyces]MDT0440586.1 FAD-dependent monooxygenase [Streptomyces sp. DSM 41981]MYQ66691.1 monooxygenase [Streptomyces sp. SID4950]SCE23831.1 3-(3-hydroxy-phenyl)propionate hydroxylase [Streptomyces sp. SolWspMP-5a-2]
MDPVIIVGAGPVGLTLALALARQEVPSVVLDESTGTDEPRPARTVVLREDTADLMERLTGVPLDEEGTRWAGWRSLRRKQVMREITFDDGEPAPLHIAQHVLTGALRHALAGRRLVRIVTESRLDAVEQEPSGVTAHTRGAQGTWWRGSYLVGCDGPRSTVRKLQDIRFPGRTAVERHAVAALRTELPRPDEALLHRAPPWRTSGPSAGEVIGRPLPDGVWRLDWLLPPGKDLVTPELLLTRVRETLAGWTGGPTPPYELLDTGVHTVHHRLARRWRAGRVFLAGDAAHLLGALGTQGLDEGLRDADNLAWKLALAWHHGPHEALLDSYQAERRAVVAARLRATDQSLPLLRGGGGLRSYVPGSGRGHDGLLVDGHLGHGPLGAPGGYAGSPLAPRHLEGEVPVETPAGDPVEDVRVTAEDGSFVRLRDRLGRGTLLVVLIAPGTGVWDRKHWMTAGIMPRLAAAVAALPHPAELLVAEEYPGATAHSVLLIRPDGHLVTALNGVRPADLYAAAETALGGPPPEPEPAPAEEKTPEEAEAEATTASR